MLQLMILHSLKEIAQVILHFNSWFFFPRKIYFYYISIYFSPIFLAVPEHAPLTKAECTFDRDSCAWRNTSTGDFQWRMAAVARRPANLLDKTYGAPVGYAYFDIFNTGSRLILTQFSGTSFQFLFLVSKSQYKSLKFIQESSFKNISRSNKVRMISPTISRGFADHMCFSFW